MTMCVKKITGDWVKIIRMIGLVQTSGGEFISGSLKRETRNSFSCEVEIDDFVCLDKLPPAPEKYSGERFQTTAPAGDTTGLLAKIESLIGSGYVLLDGYKISLRTYVIIAKKMDIDSDSPKQASEETSADPVPNVILEEKMDSAVSEDCSDPSEETVESVVDQEEGFGEVKESWMVSIEKAKSGEIDAAKTAIDFAEENQVDLSQVEGTGQNGKITKKNVQDFLE